MITNFYYSLKTKNIENSAAYFEQLGFSQIGITGEKKLLISEGTFIIELNEEAFTGLILFEDDLPQFIEKLNKAGVPIQPVLFDNKESGYLFCDLSGLQVLVLNKTKNNFLEVENESKAKCGKYYEISVKCSDVEKNIEFWKTLGFTLELKNESGPAWCSMGYKNLKLGIYSPEACNHYFEGPTLTFFDAKMEEIIKDLKSNGFVFHQLLPNKENVVKDAVAVTPEGQTLFMFNYGF